MNYKHILLAMHAAPDERPAVEVAFHLAETFDAAVTVLHVNDPGAGKAHMMMDSLPAIDEAQVRDLFRQWGLEEASERIDFLIEVHEDPVEAIATASKRADLVVMGHHPKSRVVASLSDSTDERVADYIDCPMVLVPLRG